MPPVNDAHISKALDLVKATHPKLSDALELLFQSDLDAEGPLAEAIQHLITALHLVREKKLRRRGSNEKDHKG